MNQWQVSRLLINFAGPQYLSKAMPDVMSSFELLEEQFSLSHHLLKQMERTLLIMMASATSHLGQLREDVGQPLRISKALCQARFYHFLCQRV
jgi:hypothetical protein